MLFGSGEFIFEIENFGTGVVEDDQFISKFVAFGCSPENGTMDEGFGWFALGKDCFLFAFVRHNLRGKKFVKKF